MSLESLEEEKPFSYQETKDGLVRISYKGKTVVSLSGREAGKFLNKVQSLSPERAQLPMAKATGHFKHGNERNSGNEKY